MKFNKKGEIIAVLIIFTAATKTRSPAVATVANRSAWQHAIF